LLYFLIGSYLLGSISSAIIICKICNLPDPRTKGSGNPGATNVLRIGGKKLAAFVLIFDGLKGAIPVMLAHYFGLNLFELTIILLSAFLGHVFPIYYGFKGGKGVATYLGGLIGLNFFVGLTFSIILANRCQSNESIFHRSLNCNAALSNLFLFHNHS